MTSSAVVVCTWPENEGRLPSQTEEVLTLARGASAALGVRLDWLVLGALPEGTLELAERYGVSRLDRIEDRKLDGFRPDATVEALTQYCTRNAPRLVLFAQTFDARLVAPRLAARLGSAVVMNGCALEIEAGGRLRVTAAAYGGDTRVVYELTGTDACVVGVMANAIAPEPLAEPSPPPEQRAVSVDLGAIEERIRVLAPARASGPRLEDAEIIVAGGRGLGAPEHYKLVEQLAELLGGMAAASRPIVDDGWVDSSRQVGLTGKITRPSLYLAAGISGASQHMAGCSAAKTIAAINRDPDAAIFRYARYGIVGDCLEILPELIRAASSR